jgi:uncharacterized protein involved in outer membrane biogenesis
VFSSKKRWPLVVAALLACVLTGVAVGEWLGWPFLATPLQRVLSDALDRRVRFAVDSDASAASADGVRVRFLGGLRIAAPYLEIAAPAWSTAPHLLLAREVSVALRYVDLWRAHRGQPLRIERLQASTLDGNLERLADGRASWEFAARHEPADPKAPDKPPISFGKLEVSKGDVHYRDVPAAIDVEIKLSLADSATTARAAQISSSLPATNQTGNVLRADAAGKYRALPLKIELVASGVLPWLADETATEPVPLTLNATLGQANLAFKGTASDVLGLREFTGHFKVNGPSLAAVGGSMGVTLPTTSAFRTEGTIVRRGDTWHVLVDDATIGASRLNAALMYEADKPVPMLSGRLGGTRLLLADLGPVVGMTPTPSTRGDGMVLPDRPFDLAALRVMDANVLIEIAEVDLSARFLEPLRPLRGHLQLAGGVLTLSELDAQAGQGRIKGAWRLDGRGSNALWDANLRWDGVLLEKWIHQSRAQNAPPYVSGKLNGKTTLRGQGRSTAEILATLKGEFRTELREGAVSHFVVEAAGLDLAEGLGLLFKGDDILPVQCAVADLVADAGVFRPRVMVLDTSDTAIWIDGSLSLATERLDLRAVVSPKDFSPLTLRSPLLVKGTFGNPAVSAEKGPIGRKLGASLLLALVNPLAALLPLVDLGAVDAGKAATAGCQNLMRRSDAQRALAKRVP